nr:hypothetical protein [uncultured Alistipes sp.]
MKRIGILLCSSFLMTSCATVFCGSKAKVTFDSDIAEKATLTIDGRKHTNVTFPYTTKIKRGFDETLVKVETPNFSAEPIIINKSFNAVSVINLLDILGWGIDAATGAITKPEFKFYQIDFQPKVEKSEKQ